MSAEYQGAMPRLYGAPSYSRPPRHVEVQRPFDPDDLPLESHRSYVDDRRLGQIAASQVEDEPEDHEQPPLLRAILPFGFRSNRPARSRR